MCVCARARAFVCMSARARACVHGCVIVSLWTDSTETARYEKCSLITSFVVCKVWKVLTNIWQWVRTRPVRTFHWHSVASVANRRIQGCLVLGECLSVTDTRSGILHWHRSPLLFVLILKHVTSVHFRLSLIFLQLSRLTVTVCGLVEQDKQARSSPRQRVVDNRTANPKTHQTWRRRLLSPPQPSGPWWWVMIRKRKAW